MGVNVWNLPFGDFEEKRKLWNLPFGHFEGNFKGEIQAPKCRKS